MNHKPRIQNGTRIVIAERRSRHRDDHPARLLNDALSGRRIPQ